MPPDLRYTSNYNYIIAQIQAFQANFFIEIHLITEENCVTGKCGERRNQHHAIEKT